MAIPTAERELRSPTSTDETSEHSAQSVVGQYFRMWNDGDLSALDSLLSTQWVDHSHPDRRSVDDVVRAITVAREQHPDLQVLVDAVLEGEVVTVCGRVVSGDRTENRVWIVRVEGQRLQEIWTYSAD
ncbi:MAG: nuclear transport factor 2 family protein [Lacisediminihabitans sp.]